MIYTLINKTNKFCLAYDLIDFGFSSIDLERVVFSYVLLTFRLVEMSLVELSIELC